MLVDVIMDALKYLEKYRGIKPKELANNRELLGSILWHLYVVVQGSIDLALRIISKLKLRTPKSYADAFKILEESGIISTELSKKLIDMARFRHILAHVYFSINVNVICEILKKNLYDIREYITSISKELRKRGIDITEI